MNRRKNRSKAKLQLDVVEVLLKSSPSDAKLHFSADCHASSRGCFKGQDVYADSQRELALISVFGTCLSHFSMHSMEDELERGHRSPGEVVAILMINDKAVRLSSGGSNIEEDMKNIWKTKLAGLVMN